MYQSKTTQILSSFDGTDWRACGNFLTGRLRPDHDCLVLYKTFKNRRKGLSPSDVDLDEIKTTLFPAITVKSFTNLLSKLALNLEDYLVLHATTRSSAEYDLLLLREYAQRGLYNQFDKKARRVEKSILDEENVNVFDQFNLLKINHLRYFSDNPIKNQSGRFILDSLNRNKNRFEQHYDMLLQVASLHLNEVSKPSNTQNQSLVESRFLTNVLSLLLQFKQDPTDKLFGKLFKILMVKESSLSYELSTIILELLIHRAHKQIRQGELHMINALLDLYELGFESGMLLSNNRITENRFVNVVGTACAGEKYERARNIILNYAHLLIDETRAGTIRISEAHLHFYKEEYAELVEVIRDFPFNSLWQNTRRRWMLICAYYNLHREDWDFVYNQVKNYNNYFYNNKSKMSKSMFEGSLNLSKLITKMLRGRSAGDLLAFVDSCDHFIYRKWALKEIGAVTAGGE